MAKLIVPKLNASGSSARDLIDPRQRAWQALDELIGHLQEAVPHGRDYLGDPAALEADRAIHFARIASLRTLQHSLLHEALLIQDQEG